MMDQDTRRAKIRELIETYTQEKAATPAIARQTMINEGLYTKKGQFRAEYGGGPKAKKVA
jgi:hypothetical protein